MKLSVDRLFHPDIEAIEVDQPVRLSGDLASRYPDGVHLKATVTPIVHGVHMRGILEGEERETCVRCLEPFSRHASIQFEETFSEDVGPDEDLYAEVAPLVDRSIDLADLVSQLLEVDEPLAAVCAASCQGICPTCGVNRNTTTCSCEAHTVDARLAGLARLRDELEANDKNGREISIASLYRDTMANPKQKRSKSNTRSRRSTWKLRKVTLSACPQCKHPRRPHYACTNCGYYHGRPAVKQKPEPVSAAAKG